MVTLFPTPAAPVAGRWSDPGEQRKRRHVHRPRGEKAPPRERQRKETYKPNPFRQPIGEPDELEFRHMNWQDVRSKVRTTLASCGTSAHALDRFDNCGAECLVEWSETAQRYRLRASYCRCRHCQPCMKAKATLIAANLRKRLEAGPKDDCHRFRFITLTLRHTRRPLADQIADLYRHFKVLRRSKFWKRSQIGGAVLFECKRNEKDEWHPHLHIISEGHFLKQSELANEWMRLTNGSFRADVRMIRGHKDAANYVAKYVGKGVPPEIWSDVNAAQEWVTATRGLRTCATFGTWRGFRLLQHDPADDFTDWKPIGLLSRICAQARAGSIADSNLLWILAEAVQYDPRGKVKRDATTDSVT